MPPSRTPRGTPPAAPRAARSDASASRDPARRGPRIESGGWLSGHVVFVDRSGVRWRVHDVAHGPPHARAGESLILPTPSARADFRFFVRDEPPRRRDDPVVKKCYRFGAFEIRALTVEDLERQWEKGWYTLSEQLDPTKRGR